MKANYNKRIIIVISSPSGAGKTSACHKLIERDKSIALSISDTTRLPRDNEIDGVDYNFINEDEFKNRIKNKSYIEYANVFGNFYGSQYKNIINHFKNGSDVLFDIDWQGAKQLKNSFYNFESLSSSKSKKASASILFMTVAFGLRFVTPHQSRTVIPIVRSDCVSTVKLTNFPSNSSGFSR